MSELDPTQVTVDILNFDWLMYLYQKEISLRQMETWNSKVYTKHTAYDKRLGWIAIYVLPGGIRVNLRKTLDSNCYVDEKKEDPVELFNLLSDNGVVLEWQFKTGNQTFSVYYRTTIESFSYNLFE